MKIKIDNVFYVVEDVQNGGFLPLLMLDDGTEWYIAEDREQAGIAAKEYWQDLAENDPQEFACIVGESVLINWAMDHPDGPGADKSAASLEEWLDIVAEHPEEEFGSYDGTECAVQVLSRDLYEGLGYSFDVYDGYSCVVYRHN